MNYHKKEAINWTVEVIKIFVFSIIKNNTPLALQLFNCLVVYYFLRKYEGYFYLEYFIAKRDLNVIFVMNK